MLTYAGVVSSREVAAGGAAAQVCMPTKPLQLTKPLLPLTKRQLEVLLRRYVYQCMSNVKTSAVAQVRQAATRKTPLSLTKPLGRF